MFPLYLQYRSDLSSVSKNRLCYTYNYHFSILNSEAYEYVLIITPFNLSEPNSHFTVSEKPKTQPHAG